MKIKRGVLHKLFEQKWCTKCGAVKEQTPIETHLPGILAQRCVCGACTQANFLEDDDELITVSDARIFPEGTETFPD